MKLGVGPANRRYRRRTGTPTPRAILRLMELAALDRIDEQGNLLPLHQLPEADPRVVAVAANSLLDRAFGRPKQLLDNSKQDDLPVIEQRLDWQSMSDAEIAAIEAFAVAAKARQIAAEERENHEAPAQISTSKE